MRFLGSCFAAVSIVLTACQSPTSGRERVVGFIEGGGSQQVIVAPSAVAIGQTFDVTVSTFGNTCVKSAAGADVSIDGLTARITPYDIVRDDETCLDIGLVFPRTVQVRFDHPGAATIRVHGRGFSNRDITVDHTVLVGQ